MPVARQPTARDGLGPSDTPAGWVRNEADGSVTAHAEGSGDAVDALIAWCHEGPPAARVDGVEVIPAEPEGGSGFRTVG